LQNDDSARSVRQADCRDALEEAKATHGEARDGGYSRFFQAAE